MAVQDTSGEQLSGEIAELRREVAWLDKRSGRTEEEIISETLSRLSREIHSGIAQDLAALNMRLSVWRYLVGDDSERAAAEIEELKKLVAEDVRRLKQLIFILRPISSDDTDFYSAIEAFLNDFAEQNGLQLHLQFTGPKLQLRQEVEWVLLRILQECLHNIERHAAAQSIWLEFAVNKPEGIGLLIRDDGAGFDPTALRDSKEMRFLGLRRLRERVESLGGTFSVRSKPGDGTTVEATLPLTAFGKDA